MVQGPPTKHIAFILGALTLQGFMGGSAIMDQAPDFPDLDPTPSLGELLVYGIEIFLFQLEVVVFLFRILALDFSSLPGLFQLPLAAYNFIILTWAGVGLLLDALGRIGQVIPFT